jgi:hypothetical protein
MKAPEQFKSARCQNLQHRGQVLEVKAFARPFDPLTPFGAPPCLDKFLGRFIGSFDAD